MLFAKLFSGRRDQVVRKKNSGILLPIPFKENIKILIKILTASTYPKSAYNNYSKNKLNGQLLLKHQKPTSELKTPNN